MLRTAGSEASDRGDIPGLLDLDRLAEDRYLSRANEANLNGEIFGGQFLGQALMAALSSAGGRRPQSMHGYFLRPGDSGALLEYAVERVRDGRSFSHRRVVAQQSGKTCFVADVALHDPEPDGFAHRRPMPEVPPPESLETLRELVLRRSAELGPVAVRRIVRKLGVESRPVDPLSGFVRKAESLGSRCWVRSVRPLQTDDPLLHCALLAYLSDYWANIAARNPHSENMFDASVGASSINHSLWFHEPGRADGWILFDTESPGAFGGTGLTFCAMYAQDGRLLASFAQEALMRPGAR